MLSPAMEAFVAQVAAASDILRVVGGYVQLKPRGGRYWGRCPFHQEKTPSFSVQPDLGMFYCFGCHTGGDVFKFISLIENVPYFEAVRLQAEKLNIPLPQREQSEAEQRKAKHLQELRDTMELARRFFASCLTKVDFGKAALAYLAARDINRKTIDEFRLGYAPDLREKLKSSLAKRGVSEATLLECGLLVQRDDGAVWDKFRGRVIIPIADERGQVVGFGGRVLSKDGVPKYLNSPETPLFNKRRLLFGLDKTKSAIRQARRAILVEGYMDAISLYSAGVTNVVASLGTAFTVEQCRLLLRYAPEIYFCYDSDDAGQRATMRALEVLRKTGAGAKVFIVPDGKDPDEYVRKHGAAAFLALSDGALPVREYQLRYILRHSDLRTLDGKAAALQRTLPVLAECATAIERNDYISRLARRLAVDEGIIIQAVSGYTPTALPQPSPTAAPRTVVRRADTALDRAARTVIRRAWSDPGAVEYIKAVVPLDEFPSDAHGEILRLLDAKLAAKQPYRNAQTTGELSESAASELSRALTEQPSDQESFAVFEECVQRLYKAMLGNRFDALRWRADELERSGLDGEEYKRVLQQCAELSQEINGNASLS